MVPAAPVVVERAGAVLMVFDGWREEWEPGGGRELLAVYRVRLEVAPRLLVNDEVLDFRRWPPSDPVGDGMSPLDAEIARRVARSSTA